MSSSKQENCTRILKMKTLQRKKLRVGFACSYKRIIMSHSLLWRHIVLLTVGVYSSNHTYTPHTYTHPTHTRATYTHHTHSLHTCTTHMHPSYTPYIYTTHALHVHTTRTPCAHTAHTPSAHTTRTPHKRAHQSPLHAQTHAQTSRHTLVAQ